MFGVWCLRPCLPPNWHETPCNLPLSGRRALTVMGPSLGFHVRFGESGGQDVGERSHEANMGVQSAPSVVRAVVSL